MSLSSWDQRYGPTGAPMTYGYLPSSQSRFYPYGAGISSGMGGGRTHGARWAGGGHRPGRRGKNEFGIPFSQPGASLRSPDWSKEDLQQFQKNFYCEHPQVAAVPMAEVEQWRQEHKIEVVGHDIPRPVRTFEQAGFPEYIMDEIRKAGFHKPTAIQSQGWPMAMTGRDVVGIAETGSGKTLAFLLPAIVHINAQPLLQPGDGPVVLVVAPTRELANQIEGEAAKFARSSQIKHACVYGGVSRRFQATALQRGVEIVICTPGRLLDFLESMTTNLKRVTYLVVDEADRLLDMGFEPQLRAIFSQVRPDRQILMWSATWPKDVRALAASLTNAKDTIQVSVGSWDVKANHNVTQVIDLCSPYEKRDRLFKALHEHLVDPRSGTRQLAPGRKMLVFFATKRMCDEAHRTLRQHGWPSVAIHGDKQQTDRDRALAEFKTGRTPILLATDVASRGIHVDGINVVLNYDFPGNIEDYVHRIGRTGRGGAKGMAVSFFTHQDSRRADQLIKVLQEANQEVPAGLFQMAHAGGRFAGGGGPRYRTPTAFTGPIAGSASQYPVGSVGPTFHNRGTLAGGMYQASPVALAGMTFE